MAMVVSLQRRLGNCVDGDRERQFFSHVLQYLTAIGGHRVELQNWMITSYEVEFGSQIGSGGLYVHPSRPALCSTDAFWIRTSGQVFKGTWNETAVALKVLATETGIIPSSPVRRLFFLH
jgi:hypothetical protein